MDNEHTSQPQDTADFEVAARKLAASRKRKKAQSSKKKKEWRNRYNARSRGKKSAGKAPPDSAQPDEHRSSNVSQRFVTDHIVADVEQRMKSCESASDPPIVDDCSSSAQVMQTEEQIVEQQLRELNSVDGGEEGPRPDHTISVGSAGSMKTEELIIEQQLNELNCVDGGKEEALADHTRSAGSMNTDDDEIIEQELRELNSVDGGEEPPHPGDTNDTQTDDEVMQSSEDDANEFQTIWLEHDPNRSCDNCHRRCFTNDVGSPYYFDMCLIYSHKIKTLQTPLRKIRSHRSRETALRRSNGYRNDTYHLCRECCGFLSETDAESTMTSEEKARLNRSRYKWQKLWPSFYWDLLVGRDTSSDAAFYEVYPASHLWRFIPQSIRKYWLHEEIFREDGEFFGCSEVHPPSYFRDRTVDLAEFASNIKARTCSGFIKALGPTRIADAMNEGAQKAKPFLLPDVLCPWGCGEYCHASVPFDPSLLIQRHLLKVQLNLSPYNGHDKMHFVENSRLDTIRLDNEPVDTILLNKDWTVMPSVVLFPTKGLCVLYCRNHSSPSSQRRLYTHPPKKPSTMLSSTRPDCLSHCVVLPRSVSTVRANKYNSTMTANIFSVGYAGCDSANICFEGHFNIPSIALFNHELLSYRGRRDIRDLADAKVRQGKITQELRDEWEVESSRKYDGNEEMLRLATRGSTYVPTYNAIKLQQFCTSESKVSSIVKQKIRHSNEEVDVEAYLVRSWSPTIYNVNVEDPDGYGAMMKGIKPYMGRNGNATMMLWTVVGMVSACNMLHYSIDQKSIGHHYNNYSAYLLAHIHHHYMKHSDSTCPPKSPFSGKRSSSFLNQKLERCLPLSMMGDESDNPESFYRFSFEYMKAIFPVRHYPNVRVCSTIEEVQNDTSGTYSLEQDVFITVSKCRPSGEAHFHFVGTKYEARVLIAITLEDVDNPTPNHYSGIRFSRHGGGVYSNWWKQKRNRRKKCKQMMTQCEEVRMESLTDPFPQELPDECFYYVCVYVKDVQPEAEEFRLDMFRSVGTQCSVLCGCMNANPLIMCGRKRGERRRCMSDGCNSREKYCCSNFGCHTRLCEKCFSDNLSSGGVVILDPPADDQTSTSYSDDGTLEEEQDDEEEDEVDEEGDEVPVDGDACMEEGDQFQDDLQDSDEYPDSPEGIDVDDDFSTSDMYDGDEVEGEDEQEDDVIDDELSHFEGNADEEMDEFVGMDVDLGMGDHSEYDHFVSTRGVTIFRCFCCTWHSDISIHSIFFVQLYNSDVR